MYKMQINPLDAIREETNLLELFQSTMNKSAYIDTIVKYLFEQQNEIKQKIEQKNDNCVYLKLDNLNNLPKELNEKFNPRNLKCSIGNISCKDLLNIEPMKEFLKREISNKEPMVEYLKLEPAFICRHSHCHNMIFETEEELKEHLHNVKHITIKKRIQTGKQLIIIENKTTYLSVPLFELIEKSGMLAEINNKIKSINLKCDILKETGEKLNVLEFEPALVCRQCPNKIFATREELKKHEKEHEMERKEYLYENSRPYGKQQKELEQHLKWRDRTR